MLPSSAAMLPSSTAMLSSSAAKTSLLLFVYLICVTGAVQYSDHQIRDLDSGFTAREKIDMTKFTWIYNATENATRLTICAESPLLAEGENVTAKPTLVYKTLEQEEETKIINNIEGDILDENGFCSLFQEDGIVRLPKTNTAYTLNVVVSNENGTIFRSGTVTFGLTVETSTIKCQGQPYTRATGLTNITLVEKQCLYVDQTAEEETACYLEGEFSSDPLCYTTEEQPVLLICLQGSSDVVAEEVEGQLTIDQLKYATDDTAELSLEFENDQSSESMEAIVWKDGNINHATNCSNNSCQMQNFKSGFARYDVCAVTFVSRLPVNTSTSSITDLNADAFTYDSSPLLQFGFTNAHTDRFYKSYLTTESSTKEAANLTINCAAVPLNATCRGYSEIDVSLCNGTYVTVEYASANEAAMGNKINFPCKNITKKRV